MCDSTERNMRRLKKALADKHFSEKELMRLEKELLNPLLS